MLRMNRLFSFLTLAAVVFVFSSCDKKDNTTRDDFDTSGTYTIKDQMGRPAVATVFIGASRKDEFNATTPSAMSAKFKADITDKLTAFGYSANALGQSKDQFASLLATDVLNVKTSGTTTF